MFDTLGGDVLAKSWQTLKPIGRLASIIDTPDEETAKQLENRSPYRQPLFISHFSLQYAAKAHTKSESGRA